VDELTLLDWKRRVFALYAEVRADREPRRAWQHWCGVRDELFRTHPQSPAPGARPRYFDYDPALRASAVVDPAERVAVEIATSGAEAYSFMRFATARFELMGAEQSLDLYWLDGYGGGVFLSFADATSGSESYGACRYLLDTVKGADLGEQNGRLVLDFNFAYNPSCAYDPRWVCPLAPPRNRLEIPVGGGELAPPEG
jgi:uncharacterized protein